jgi:rhodanese-related sulfurtransferase
LPPFLRFRARKPPTLVYCPLSDHPGCGNPAAHLTLNNMDTYLEFAGNHTLLVGALFFSFFLLLFTELRRKAAGVINIEAPEAVKLINSDAAVIDLRSAEAFARGHIVGAKNIPFDELQANVEKVENMKSRSVIAVCDAGITSTKAVNILRKTGIESVYGLKGGMNGWSQSGMPVVSAKKTKRKS